MQLPDCRRSEIAAGVYTFTTFPGSVARGSPDTVPIGEATHMANLPTVNDSTFESEVIKSNVPVLVDFSATWCGPCKALAPVLEGLAKDYTGKVKIVTLDIDEARNSAIRFNVMSVPTMILFKGGQIVTAVTGARPRGEIAGLLDGALGA